MRIALALAAAAVLASPALALDASPQRPVFAEKAKNALPPAADAVWDVRSACLSGEVETKKVSDKERIKACDQLQVFETKAQDAGYCWNTSYAEYKKCEQP